MTAGPPPLRLLVTGGTGFLGSSLVRQAHAAGHAVAVLSRDPDAPRIPAVPLAGRLEDPPWDAIDRFAPDICVHAAWIATPGVYLDAPENADWHGWSADFLRRLADRGTRRFVVLGTCIEYRPTGQPLSEDTTPIEPASPYARAKDALHRELRATLPGTLAWARIFYPYGEGEHPDRLASSVIRRLAAGERVGLRTPDSVKDYIHVDDVGSALLRIAESGFDGPVNVGTGTGVTVGEIARWIADRIGRSDLLDLPTGSVADPLDHVVADATRLRSLGWSPKVTLADGLHRLVDARTR